MIYRSKNDDNLSNKIPSIDPKVIDFVSQNINPNLSPEQIAFIVNSIKPQPNPIFGEITNLSYQENSNNLVKVQINNIFILSAECNPDSDSNTIKIINLNDFQVRLQEAFYYKFSVNIFYENNAIVLLEINRFRVPPGVQPYITSPSPETPDFE
jgi:hypothetical protein